MNNLFDSEYKTTLLIKSMDRSFSQEEASSPKNEGGSKKAKEEFKCGESKCSKLYHSYTAFYNHCKKAHSGEFPINSLLNGQIFEGPTKNRGRPRMKKNQVKNQFQIESMKAENELIQFLGTIRVGTSKSNEEVISYVEDPLERLKEAVSLTKTWVKEEDRQAHEYFQNLLKTNRTICENDLPEFYDPIEHEKYKDRVDSYNFSSIFKFFKKNSQPELKIEWLLICWLTRILSLKLLTETIYILLQFQLDKPIKEIDFYVGKSQKFRTLVNSYIKFVELEHEEYLDQ